MRLLAQLASLLAAGLIVWPVAASSRLPRQSVFGVAAQALELALLAALVSAAVMTAFQLANAGSLEFDGFRTPLRTAQTAIWLAPIALLFPRSPVAALVVTLVFTVSVTELVYSEWAESGGGARSHTRFQGSGFALALGAQTTIVAVWMGAPLLAAALLCLSAAGVRVLYLVAVSRRAQPPNWPKSLVQVVVSVILGVGMTVGGRFPGFQSALQSRFEPDPKTRARPHEFVTNLYEPSSAGRREITDKSFPGVILWPEVTPAQETLVAPASTWVPSPLRPVPRTPSDIPFSGQYWMFKPPQDAPPRGSYFKRASLLDQSFLTTDQRPLSMEGVQKLTHALDLSCCRAIQVAIENADRYPGTIALELLLIDSQAPGQPVQSLGKRDVLSRPQIKPLDLSPIPATEILDFPVPRVAEIREFDAMQVVFHRAFFRIDRSARISIERFTLVPP